jgi:tRNA(fMet)-specific endonuclease VapC
MSGRFLLDTNTIIDLFAGKNSVKENLMHANEVFISSIAIGELYFGAYKSHNTNNNLRQIDDFTASCTVLCCNQDTAHEYGIIKNKLREKGMPIPENDIWIASIARQYDLILITSDNHFDKIEDLKHEKW